MASTMYTLVDRATGNVITTIGDSDFQIFQDHLVSESSEDFDFYLNQASLMYLQEQGLDEQIVKAFEGRLDGRGMDLGWEKETPEEGDLHTGTVVDDEGQPLGGIRVDLLDHAPLKTGRLQAEHTLLDWTYSRADGAFRLQATKDAPGTELRFSGRGDLVLSVAEVSAIGEQGQFRVQTITGTVKTEVGPPLSGVSVQLLNWSLEDGDSDDEDALGGSLSWGDTDETGRFAIPVHLPEDSGYVTVSLEILAPSGETLYEGDSSFDPSEGFEIGELVAKRPSEDYGDEELDPDSATERPFEHPLG
jgi:hypothetical protein